ncbi:amidohydrolase [Shewanella oneidensis MR-1]|uniref:Periplasmic amidohydrolase family protein n=1 Tax=Shewanella oneidensis (strain ATCC 700550 / JCM 31522 / CIP 106686 / LMG 19005 / NCIMB 14063 / MR-1) TaxID=211586 RepID=Q8ECJ3_SHEON|nr:amidohydrolase [Shewanella oneidensis]AAN56149.1 periplasmic amidohydrolase family protein [Shewanella oneidensis MR-1]MDX5999420.1 amidohydrolase [Shewanella oneidensis]MEE2026467.1 Adenine deaminase [Shewanella oneidensis]QKG97582.1 amidohydrolase [Shewanella oneidensis MR-1]
MKHLPTTLLLSTLAITLSAQAHNLVPAPKQTQSVLIKNATVHTVIQGVLTNTDVLIENGKISALGPQLSTNTTASTQVVDASGKHLYPGLIALDTSLGLVEIEMVRPTVDNAEVGDVNPQISAASAYNPDSELLPTIRYNGITHAQIVPSGDGLAGQSVVVDLDAWTIEDALQPNEGQFHVYWPQIKRMPEDEKEKAKAIEKNQQAIDKLITAFEDGYRYFLSQNAQDTDNWPNLRWQAMLPLYQGKATLFAHADSVSQIEQVIALTKKYQFKLVIVGGYDAWRLASSLREVNASVIYPHTLSLPKRKDEPVDLPFKIPSLLANAGIPYALGFSSDWNSRNLPYAAGYSAAYGVTPEQALKSVTLDAAKLLGIADLGAIAVGYQGSVVLSDGDILDPMSSKIDAIWIEGRQIDLNNRHQQLYQKYLKR